jgi:hypothetical protein
MICPLNRRTQTMREVVAQLEAMRAWETTAVSLPMDSTTREAITRLQGQARSDHQAAVAAADARAAREELVARVRDAFLSWAKAELTKSAAHIATSHLVASASSLKAGAAETPPIPLSERSRYEVLAGCELVLKAPDPAPGHALQLLLCAKRTVTVKIGVGVRSPPPPEEVAPELTVLSAYARPPSAGGPGAPPRRAGYLTRRNSIGQVLHFAPMQPRRGPGLQTVTLQRIAGVFRPEYSLNTPFKADEWNVALQGIRAQLQEAIGVFIEFVMEEHPSIGA